MEAAQFCREGDGAVSPKLVGGLYGRVVFVVGGSLLVLQLAVVGGIVAEVLCREGEVEGKPRPTRTGDGETGIVVVEVALVACVGDGVGGLPAVVATTVCVGEGVVDQ